MTASELRLSIPAGPRMELTALAPAEAFAVEMALSQEKIDEIKLALVEACINAFEHGAPGTRHVEVRLRAVSGPEGREAMEVSVTDSGAGFDPRQVEEPSLPRKLGNGGRKRGWGLALIRGMMDEVDIRSTERGTTIVMRKFK